MKALIFSKNFWQKFSLILGSLIFSLILVEVILRIFWPPSIITDPYLGWRGNGKGFDINGFRNEQVLTQADIAVMGDSMTYGAGSEINQAWPQVLAKISQKSVYQMALGGYGTVQYDYLLDQAFKMQAKTIIFGFFIGNDFYDVLRTAYTNPHWQQLRNSNYAFKDFVTPAEAEELNGLMVHNQENYLIKWIKQETNWLTSRLYLSRFISVLISTLSNQKNTGDRSISDSKVLSYLNEHPGAGYMYTSSPQETFLIPTYSLINLTDNDLVEATRINNNLFLESNNKVKQNEASLIIAIIPTKELVYASALLRQGQVLPQLLSDIYAKENGVLENTQKFCSDNNLSCIFMLEPLVEKFIQGQVIYHNSIDGHPNTQGYKIIAQAIANYLNSQK